MPEPFFIVGNDRSGTTMLRLIVDRGPDAAVPPESMFLTDFAGAFDAGAPCEAYAALHGKPRWGDKTPHYVHHVDHLLGLWPGARFVVLVRDGRDVALSLRRLPFGPNNAWAAAQWWARGVRAGTRAQDDHPDAVLTVRYEDLAAAPQEEVRRLCAFLGLGYDDDMLALEHVDPARIVPDQAAWFPTLFDGINTSAVGRWRREMSRRDRRIFAALAGAELEQLGYEVESDAVPALSAREERWLHYHNELMRNVNFLRLRLVQERGRELRFALARRLRDPVKRQYGSR